MAHGVTCAKPRPWRHLRVQAHILEAYLHNVMTWSVIHSLIGVLDKSWYRWVCEFGMAMAIYMMTRRPPRKKLQKKSCEADLIA